MSANSPENRSLARANLQFADWNKYIRTDNLILHNEVKSESCLPLTEDEEKNEKIYFGFFKATEEEGKKKKEETT